MPSFSDLPIEICLLILNQVNKSTLLQCLVVSKKTHIIVTQMLQQDIILSKKSKKVLSALKRNIIIGHNVRSVTFESTALKNNINAEQAIYMFESMFNLRSIRFRRTNRDIWYLENLNRINKDSLKQLREIKLDLPTLIEPVKTLFYKVNLKFSNTITHLDMDTFQCSFFNIGDKYRNVMNYLSNFVNLTHLSIKNSPFFEGSAILGSQLNIISILTTCKKLVSFTFHCAYIISIDTEETLLHSLQSMELIEGNQQQAAASISLEHVLKNSKHHRINKNLQYLDLSLHSLTRAEIIYLLHYTPVVLKSFALQLKNINFNDWININDSILMYRFSKRITSYNCSDIGFTDTITRSTTHLIKHNTRSLTIKSDRGSITKQVLEFINPINITDQGSTTQTINVTLSDLLLKNDLLQNIIESIPLVQSLDLSTCRITRDDCNNSIIDLVRAKHLKRLSLNLSSLQVDSSSYVFIKVEFSQEKVKLFKFNKKSGEKRFEETSMEFLMAYKRFNSYHTAALTFQCHQIDSLFINVEKFIHNSTKPIILLSKNITA